MLSKQPQGGSRAELPSIQDAHSVVKELKERIEGWHQEETRLTGKLHQLREKELENELTV